MIIHNEIMISLVTFHLFINSVYTKHHKRIFYTFLEFIIPRIFKFWGNIVLAMYAYYINYIQMSSWFSFKITLTYYNIFDEPGIMITY